MLPLTYPLMWGMVRFLFLNRLGTLFNMQSSVFTSRLLPCSGISVSLISFNAERANVLVGKPF